MRLDLLTKNPRKPDADFTPYRFNFHTVAQGAGTASGHSSMSRASSFDSAGVGALVAPFVSRRDTGKKLTPAALAEQNIALLQVSGLIDLPVCASVDLAIWQIKM